MSEDFRDRPSMLDQQGHRLPMYPAEVHGVWRKRRTIVHLVLMALFLSLPWIQINGDPAVLIDLNQHRLTLFGLKLWAHDAPLLFLVLGMFAVGLAVVTALWGRAWCGWACPQTVFLDGFIRRIERWTEGSHLQRRFRDQAPWGTEKILRKSAKWILFILFTAVLTNSFLAYFFGAHHLMEMMASDPRENWGKFLFAFVVNALVLFDLTWFREQFCLIVCPYGRLQSVLMDSQTITVQYDATRGEPRKQKGVAEHGACISCSRCVSVCPTGIDIRNGVQLECIACTACIDACDDVMAKTQQPLGLIRHRALSSQPTKWLRPRVGIYVAAFVCMLAAFTISLSGHNVLSVTVLRGLDTPYFEKVDASGTAVIVNSYRLHAHNQTDDRLKVQISLLSESDLKARLHIPESMLDLNSNQSLMIPFIVEIPKSQLLGRDQIRLNLRIQGKIYEVNFVAPQS